jgi:hypothetical protein
MTSAATESLVESFPHLIQMQGKSFSKIYYILRRSSTKLKADDAVESE